MEKKSRGRLFLLLFGGILPVIAFAVVEEKYGVIWGTIAGMIFGVGEIIYEKLYLKRVSGVTWFSNVLILVLGGMSLISADGVWFKLQPAISLLCFSGILAGSSVIKKPLLPAMAAKQNPNLPPQAIEMLGALNARLSFVFFFMAGLSTWAALRWSTEAWAFLKSVGVFLILVAYMASEVLYRRYFKIR